MVKNFHLLFEAMHPFVGIYFVNNGTNSVSFDMVRTKKNILSKCFCFVTHGVYYFTTFVLCTNVNYVDMIQSMNGIVCWYNLLCFEINMTKKSNLMILDNSGIDYSRMLLFVLGFLVYCKIEPNSHAFSRIRQHVVYDLISKRSHQNCQKNKIRQQFLMFYYNK